MTLVTDPPGDQLNEWVEGATDPVDGDRHFPTRLRPRRRSFARRIVRGRQGDPAWARPGLLLLLGLTALAYLWSLSRTGWANPYYSAAVQAGSRSWKAFFFGSADGANFLSVDKPPVSLWVMDISARLFGFNPWSVLVPQALEGVAMVGVVYATVRRWFGSGAGLLAGFVAASTPVCVLMFRVNYPDALLTLLVAISAYATLRAVERGSTWWLVAAGGAVGFAFLTKMMEAFLVLPALALAFAVGAPGPRLVRLKKLLLAGVATIVASGWWVAAVQLTPSADRPYIGSTTDNNMLNLVFGYNGLGRLSGNELSGGVSHRPSGWWGPVGLIRLFSVELGGEISWVLFAALIFLVVILWDRRRAARTDRSKVAMILFGAWLLVGGLAFSYAKGIFHPYYVVLLAPPIAAIVGIGVTTCWQRRQEVVPRVALAVAIEATGAWSFALLLRGVNPMSALALTILALSLLVALAVGLRKSIRRPTALAVAAMGLALATVGPIFYDVQTVGKVASGRALSSGPPLRGIPPSLPSRPIGNRLVDVLSAGAPQFEFEAAVVGGDAAAGYELATGQPVMDIGGYHGTLDVPTPLAFRQLVGQGRIHWFVLAQNEKSVHGGSAAAVITRWVEERFASRTVDGVHIYDLQTPRGD